MIRFRAAIGAAGAMLMLFAVSDAAERRPPARSPTSRAEIPRVTVYAPPSYQPLPPPSPYAAGYWGRPWSQPPVGFGSPYYNGYNDPYFNSYGPGVREFLRFGGADFYGW